jgi:catechol 2,3-dioxygenase-like lactoylglutathione lyase family enzyme
VEVSVSLKSVGAITLFVEDPRRSQSFYENVFELSAVYEDDDSAAFKFENMIVNLLETSAAPGLAWSVSATVCSGGSVLGLRCHCRDAGRREARAHRAEGRIFRHRPTYLSPPHCLPGAVLPRGALPTPNPRHRCLLEQGSVILAVASNLKGHGFEQQQR